MKTGLLNKRIEVWKRAAGKNEWGETLPDAWQLHHRLWANIRHLSGSQAIKADAPVSTVRASIRIRFRMDIDAGMQVHYKGTVYDIKAVLPDLERREHTDLVCEVVA